MSLTTLFFFSQLGWYGLSFKQQVLASLFTLPILLLQQAGRHYRWLCRRRASLHWLLHLPIRLLLPLLVRFALLTFFLFSFCPQSKPSNQSRAQMGRLTG